MCLQDQRMAAGGSPVFRVDTVPAAGPVALPDMTGSLWFGVFESTGVAVNVSYQSVQGLSQVLPKNAEMVGPLGTAGYSTRDQCGSLFRGPLVYTADGVKSYYVQQLKMDATTFSAIDNSVAEG